MKTESVGNARYFVTFIIIIIIYLSNIKTIILYHKSDLIFLKQSLEMNQILDNEKTYPKK